MKEHNGGFVNSVNITHSPTFSTFAVNFFRFARATNSIQSTISPDLIKVSLHSPLFISKGFSKDSLCGIFEELWTQWIV